MTGNLCSDGQNQFIERIYGLNKMPVNGLPYFPYAHFPIEHDLQGSSLWNR